ncbi:MAG TPA: DUF4199 domain-containing protein [Chitinophagaceae bacterium]|nr:DUF4199 domain-containing protein [Chitinophagaceae bacterium]HMZ45472.1 DUF4199 domain-containing protein [Chitinophagaceae bacterium]HNE92646.1 DUF4199 domain-containing protein [Chitinophagaceae bacterium]HNF29855.1 DUF4199 domain-containing protein [Chitinophagaceae bacterium]HNM35095.1 DUF4199 domain-containing protein [Chitinophagaceae bacterium]
MEQKPLSVPVKGLIISLVLIVLGLIIHFAGLSQIKGLQLLQYVILGSGLIWACITYAKQNNGNVTFGNTFAHGFKVTAAITGIIAVYTFLAIKFIMPEMIDYAIDEARKGMVEGNKMTAEQIEQALAMTRKFFLPFALAGVIVGFLVLGVIFSLIGAAVAKKNPNYSPIQNQ